MAPHRLVVKSKYANLHGGYFLSDTRNNLPIYRKDKDNSINGKQAWMFNERKQWFISDTRPPDIEGSQFGFIAQSSDDAASPDLAQWPMDVIDSVKEPRPLTDLIKREASSLFVDSSFPHAPKSLGRDLQAQWVPARCLWEGRGNLFDGVEPRDLLQGALGDCWFVAALACLAEFPDRVHHLFLHPDAATTTKLDHVGKYTVQLWDANLEKRIIDIDEFIPCQPVRWWDDHAEPLFSKPHGNEAWVLLLEKAMAKLMGSYDALEGGNPAVAFRAFTGESNTFMWKLDGGWKKWMLKKGSEEFISEGSAARQSSEDVFLSLAEYDRSSYLMSASISSKKNVKEFKRDDGLVEGHAYSVLQVVEVEGHRLLCLRNPWGNNQEWKLGWSDGDKKWSEFPRVKLRLQPRFEADGLFWISWEDFQSRFSSIYVCASRMRTQEAAEAHSNASQDGQQSLAIVSAPSRVVRKPPASRHSLRTGHYDENAPPPPNLPNGYPHMLSPRHHDSHAPPPPSPGRHNHSTPHPQVRLPAGHNFSHISPGHQLPSPGKASSPNHPYSDFPTVLPRRNDNPFLAQNFPTIAPDRHGNQVATPPSPLSSQGHFPTGSLHSHNTPNDYRATYRPWMPGDYVDPNEPPPPEPPRPGTQQPQSLRQGVHQPRVSSGHYYGSHAHQPHSNEQHRKSPRRKRSESPPTPPPPDMPFAFSQIPSAASPYGTPTAWNPNSSPHSSQPILQHLVPYAASSDHHRRLMFGTPLQSRQPHNSDRSQMRADIASLTQRVRSLVQNTGGSTSQRARLLVEELGNIESFCENLGDEWSAVQNMLENLRSELVGRDVKSPRGQQSVRTALSTRHSVAAPTGRRIDDPRNQAREAFRERMTKLMRLYGDGDNAYDVDSVFREMDSEYPYGAPHPQDKHMHESSWPPAPERLPAHS